MSPTGRAYLRALETNPLATKMATSASLMAVGDGLAQVRSASIGDVAIHVAV